MLKNYFKTAWRNLWRNREFTFINISGLALGIILFLFIMQYVAFEWNANRYNKNYSQLYRLNVVHKDGVSDYTSAPGFATFVKQQVPAVKNYVRVADGIAAGVITYQRISSSEQAVFSENNISYVDSTFLDVFSFPIIAGTSSLAEPKTLALSETISKKMFGKTDVIGKTITISNQFGNTIYTINAVYKQPQTSDIKAEVLLSIYTLESAANRDKNDWADPSKTQYAFVNAYIQLEKGSNPTLVNNQITTIVQAANPRIKDDKIVLQPFSQLHLAPSFNYPYQTFGSLTFVTVFFCVAVLILLIAWINYINLSNAQALNRLKEVGVKKVLGASRLQLMFQYLTETFILTISSTLIAVLMVNIFQNTFNDFAGKQLSLAVFNNSWFWLAGIAFVIIGSVLSGSYVAFLLTAYKPVTAFSGKINTSIKTFSLRKALVVFQFTISIVFIIATIILYRQLQYMQTEKLGMNLNKLLVIQGPTVSSEGQAARNVSFKNELTQLPFVKKIAASNNVPGVGYNFSTDGITKLNAQKGDEQKSYSMFICDQNFFDTYGINFAQGQSFNQNDAERSWNKVQKVILNEKAAQQLGFNIKDNLIGQKISWGKPYEIIGVVKDYHHISLQEEIKPVIYLASVSFSYFTIQTDVHQIKSKLNTIKQLFDQNFPGNPFEYFFADEKYNQQYASQKQLGKMFIASALIAILIACMGLFGLATFSARQRIKEIGIRKVLGASIADITTLLSTDFLKLVLISFIIASPVAYFTMHKWLQNFAYQISIQWWVFALAGFIAIIVALLTISFQAIKAALANPVKSLRSE